MIAITFIIYGTRKYFQKRTKLIQTDAALVKAKIQNLEDSLKVKTLTSFFHPHFINNTLNWVQSRHRKDPETGEIVENLADSINLIYQSAQAGRSVHSMANEMALVRRFVDIQLIRFNRQFFVQYETPANETLRQCIDVPILLLQIFVENAIEKGIFGKRRLANQLLVRILSDEQGFSVHIEDDGVGYAPQPTKEQNRKGSTTRMFELVEILNQHNPENPIVIHYETPIYYLDPLQNEAPHGTRVVIYLPKNYRYVQDIGD